MRRRFTNITTHEKQAFVDTNVTRTLNLLEEATTAGVRAFVFTSSTSVFGRGLSAIVLRTSRFFPDEDDRKATRDAYEDDNVKANEFLYRRADIEDVVNVHLLALEKAPAIGFGRYIVSATTPFTSEDLQDLHTNAPAAVARRVPGYVDVYARRGWSMFPHVDRVYVNDRARAELGWSPCYDFARVTDLLRNGNDFRSALARAVGTKLYHEDMFPDGPYPVEETNRPQGIR